MNQYLFNLIHRFAGHSALLDFTGVFFANYLPYLLALGFLWLLFKEKNWRRRWYYFAEGAVAVILSRGIVTEVIRHFYYHVRPFEFYNFTPLIPESGSSFPSGHAAFFFALALAIWYMNRTWGIWYLALSLVNGLSRIYVGVHWPYDIFGGIVVGLVSAFLVHLALKKTKAALFAAPQNPLDLPAAR